MGLRNAIMPGHQSQVLKQCPLMGCVHPLVVAGSWMLLPCIGGQGWPLERLQCWPQWLMGSSGRGYHIVSCEAWLRCRGGWGSKWGVPTGANRLEGEFQNGTHQHWNQQGSLRLEKWLPPVSQSPESIPTRSCLSSRCFKISRWVPSTYGSCTFQSGVFVLVFRWSECECECAL